ncbi:MAG: methylmalonyl-CoA mutase, partial [Gammaproteobacteria bacterium]|nr:methylmalonyl-CoA mutase [Gammaproteobacteria bacterium]
MSEEPRIRCLLGMLGTDVHSKGVRTLAQLLRDAGIEVIYIGEHNTVPGMVRTLAKINCSFQVSGGQRV